MQKMKGKVYAPSDARYELISAIGSMVRSVARILKALGGRRRERYSQMTGSRGTVRNGEVLLDARPECDSSQALLRGTLPPPP